MGKRFISFAVAAFCALGILMLVIIINGQYGLVAINNQLQGIVEVHNRKIDIVTQTQLAGFRVTDNLYSMTIHPDPFERDNYYLEFNRAGFAMCTARQTLLNMDLSAEEKTNYDHQSKLIEDIVEVEHGVIDLLAADQLIEARRVLIHEAVPLQRALNQTLAEMRDIQKRITNDAVVTARNAYKRVFIFNLCLGFIVLGLAGLIAYRVYRKLVAQYGEIEATLRKLEESKRDLHDKVTHDSLTGLANRVLFYDRCAQALEYAKRHNSSLAVLFMDLDGFKKINDVYGHDVGDSVLKLVAQRIKDCIRAADTVARLAGDEFAILMEQGGGKKEALALSKKIKQVLVKPITVGEIQLEVGISIGSGIYPEDGDFYEVLMRYADKAMYRDKKKHAKKR